MTNVELCLLNKQERNCRSTPRKLSERVMKLIIEDRDIMDSHLGLI